MTKYFLPFFSLFLFGQAWSPRMKDWLKKKGLEALLENLQFKLYFNVINNLYNQKQVENIHIIINDFKHTSSGYGYGYGYGYGSSGYGYYENEEN